MKYLLLVCCALSLMCKFNQERGNSLDNTMWQHAAEKYIYLMYFQGEMYEITDYSKSSYPSGGIDVTIKEYGFYDSCELPSLDSLKQSGTYYFQVDSSDFANEEKDVNIHNACGELSFYVEGKDTLMNIHYGSRQQYVTYRKVNTLPNNVRAFLRKKKIKLHK